MVNNPWMTQADPYFNGHKVGVEDHMKQNPEELELQRLCYEVFISNAEGVKLYEIITERFVNRGMFNPMHPNADKLALYFEGFKEAFRGIYAMAVQHQKRIQEQT